MGTSVASSTEKKSDAKRAAPLAGEKAIAPSETGVAQVREFFGESGTRLEAGKIVNAIAGFKRIVVRGGNDQRSTWTEYSGESFDAMVSGIRRYLGVEKGKTTPEVMNELRNVLNAEGGTLYLHRQPKITEPNNAPVIGFHIDDVMKALDAHWKDDGTSADGTSQADPIKSSTEKRSLMYLLLGGSAKGKNYSHDLIELTNVAGRVDRRNAERIIDSIYRHGYDAETLRFLAAKLRGIAQLEHSELEDLRKSSAKHGLPLKKLKLDLSDLANFYGLEMSDRTDRRYREQKTDLDVHALYHDLKSEKTFSGDGGAVLTQGFDPDPAKRAEQVFQSYDFLLGGYTDLGGYQASILSGDELVKIRDTVAKKEKLSSDQQDVWLAKAAGLLSAGRIFPLTKEGGAIRTPDGEVISLSTEDFYRLIQRDPRSIEQARGLFTPLYIGDQPAKPEILRASLISGLNP